VDVLPAAHEVVQVLRAEVRRVLLQDLEQVEAPLAERPRGGERVLTVETRFENCYCYEACDLCLLDSVQMNAIQEGLKNRF